MILVQQQRKRFVVSSVIRRIHCTALRELYRIQLQSICSDCTVTVVIYGHLLPRGSRAASFKHVCMCLCVGNFYAKYLGTKRFRGSCPIRTWWESAYGTSIGDSNPSMTSHGSMTAYSWSYNLQSRCIGKLGAASTIHPLSRHYHRTVCQKTNSFSLELWQKKHLV